MTALRLAGGALVLLALMSLGADLIAWAESGRLGLTPLVELWSDFGRGGVAWCEAHGGRAADFILRRPAVLDFAVPGLALLWLGWGGGERWRRLRRRRAASPFTGRRS